MQVSFFLLAVGTALIGCQHPDGLPGGKEEVLIPYPTDGGTVEWDGWAGEFVRAYCVECHNPMATNCGGSGCHSPGDPRIAPNFEEKAAIVAQASTIRCGISVTQEPSWKCGVAPKSFPVFLGQNALPTDEQRGIMVGWFDAGCP